MVGGVETLKIHGEIKIKCGRGLAPDSGMTVTDVLTEPLLSGASPLPQF